MRMDDDLFNDPENDAAMLDANEDEDEEDEDEEMSVKDEANEQDEEGEGEDEDEDGDGEDDEDEDDDDEDEDDENENKNNGGEDEDDDDDDDDDDDEDDEGDDNADESKYIDAKETQNENEETDGMEAAKENLLEQFRDDLKEEERKESIAREEEREVKEAKENGTDDMEVDEQNTEDNNKDSSADGDHTEANGNETIENGSSNQNGSVHSPEKEMTFREKVTDQAEKATKFDIVPTVAIPYASQCHAIAFAEGPRWILTGGEDGFIRKYDFIASIEGKSPLTMAQKHNLVDTVTKAGVIVSYWENEEPQTRQQLLKANPKLKISDFAAGTANYEPKLSPVYALDVNRNGYWCLSGSSKGGIALYTMRYNEGSIHHYFMQGNRKQNNVLSSGHSDTISVLKLNSREEKFLSGSWDKTIREWDLDSGKCTNLFLGSTGQVSNIQYRPLGLTDFSVSIDDESSEKPEELASTDIKKNAAEGSDIDSLFGDSDEEDDDERKETERKDKSSPAPAVQSSSNLQNKTYSNDSIFMSSTIDGTISIWDIRVSEQNGSNSVLKLGVPENTPPWCMASTWSNCGDYIYVGRRNSTVEEFSMKMPHKRSTIGNIKGGTMTPNVSKTLVFPKISGPISALSTMPNKDFLLCGSNDNIRLYNLSLYNGVENSNISGSTKNKPATPFMIIPGHHGGILSALWLDDTGRFMVSASGNRGWGHANYTETVLLYEIDFE